MARIELDYPDEVFTFTTELIVRSTDINFGAHLGNESLVAMISEVRFQFWTAAGAVDLQSSHTPVIVTDLALIYRAEAFLWERLRFDLGFTEPNRYGGDIAIRVTRVNDGVLVAMAKSGFVYYDYQAGAVTPMPAEFAEGMRRGGLDPAEGVDPVPPEWAPEPSSPPRTD